MADELYHHGIKGQKWGFRRYQEPNGTWTEEGLRRRRKYEMTPAKKKMLEDLITNRNTIHDDWDVYKKAKQGLIEKGTPIYRSTTRLEDNDDVRKYASITKAGGSFYAEQVGFGDLMVNDANSDETYTYRFEATKDLKLAKMSDLADYAESLSGKKFTNKFKETRKMMSNEENFYINNLSNKTGIDKKETNRFINHFKDLGYDAIPDMVDLGYNYDNMTGAIIFLKPYESLKVTDIYKNIVYDLPYEADIEEYMKSGKLDKRRVG